MKKTTVPIRGMHCRSCELLIEDELMQIPGVSRVNVSEKRACAEVYYENDDLKVHELEGAVKNAGYEIGFNDKKPWLSKNLADYADIFYAGVALFFLYVIVSVLGLAKLFGVSGGHPTSLVTVLLIGLTAGFSTCMALVGGLVLGVSTQFAKMHPAASTFERFIPHIWFNAGRIISYLFFGAIIGAIGSLFQLSSFSLGFMTLAVALVMLSLGMQLTGLFPRLDGLKLTLPKGLSRMFGMKNSGNSEYSHANSILMGGSTFFLPCGFTQAMQLYAVSTGNAFSGAMIMGVFAVGTAPGLLGIGGITALVRGIFAQKFFKFAGVVVIVLSLFNMNNAFNLIGWNPIASVMSGTTVADDVNVVREGDVQIVRMQQGLNGYTPNTFTIAKGIPVRWIINSVDVNTCASSIVSSKINVRTNLHPGENIIEFTPAEVGTISFTCSMGMFRGSFTVVENSGGAVVSQQQAVVAAEQVPSPTQLVAPPSVGAAPAGGAGSCGSGGCGCSGGAKKPVVEKAAPAAEVGAGEQVIKTTYTSVNDITPNTFTVKAGIPVRMEIEVKEDGYGCMGSIMVSRLTQPQILTKGKTIIFTFTPESPGEYPITCAMGIPRGKIKAI